jgi:hypothetical protein
MSFIVEWNADANATLQGQQTTKRTENRKAADIQKTALDI